ncbi:hypothetical protein SS1G_05223 [Sclerotinia sclerotiorum 1980 UF-70]|uniref:Methyltransferase domain-containing protein n=2 Tax=Sclerotinia sclerotiorum (strain ATCC 18683 / 1980 / Ss-1) TaxID=665079 RepID=A7EIT0_SCLS1|nr:hypothetical protein SS1G_05223 [Sclerotinia sclerotiorum 1980 UF-70]APA11737.1 hypothetical protein sscle_08g065070 [Sclerotinia sclerotiorum 1980 UF-70]EDO02746.1 hypothetical protein SS1G_05223 [Sclerotinia sclerotiorum 1980 UF-70]
MSTQYDSIGAKYDTLNVMPIQQIQHVAMKRLIGTFDSPKRVLELACGTGFYTRQMVSWGASHVTALDISPAMVSTAQKSLPAEMKDNVTFCVGDCARPDIWDSAELKDQKGTFDLVVAAWLLNYAPSRAEMQRMFENIYAALKPGGKFVGLTVHAAIIDKFQPDDPLNENEKHLGTVYEVLGKVDDGYRTCCHAFTEPEIKWEFYFLREDVYSKAALGAGMGELEWNVVLPGEEQVEKLGKEYWQSYLDRPKAAICISRKPDLE